MLFVRTRPPLAVSETEAAELKRLAHSRTESHRTIVRARILLGYFQKRSLADLVQEAGISRVADNKVINKALVNRIENTPPLVFKESLFLVRPDVVNRKKRCPVFRI